jgi:predicted DNA-binding WGR domain protein
MTNWGSTGSKTKEMVNVFGDNDTVEDFEKTLASKTLSELQEMAMKLGFTPSFDRNRIIKVLRQDYLSRT